jgi:hypothetical protein
VLFEILGKKNLISQSQCQLRNPKKSSTDILVPKKWSGTACYSFRNISKIFEFLKIRSCVISEISVIIQEFQELIGILKFFKKNKKC